MTPSELEVAEFGHHVLQDIGLICAIGAVLSAILYAWLRRAAPSLQWHNAGKVPTYFVQPIDVLGCLLVILPFTLTLMTPFQDNSETQITTFAVIINFSILLMMAGIVVALYQQRGVLEDALGIRPENPTHTVAWSIGTYIAFFVILIALGMSGMEDWLSERLGEKQNQDVVNELLNAQNTNKRLVLILGACVIAPLAEEIIFRGYLYPVLKRFTEPAIAAILTGVLFGAIHGQIWAVIPLSIFGILLAVLYEKSGSIWACILCHALFNSINVFFMLTMGDKI
ncbi:CPBP family intramembrane glutamic endopeptidase [Rubritalea marina]|uniref:CPBP family intramembrane glutamic endopeptidase n=1 Tax=Rubritalea marina TaxID=361055 RepID=UPI0003758F30|nr:CPBP family intramembrane glutamic endopeptidase [Rubritalea marina]